MAAPRLRSESKVDDAEEGDLRIIECLFGFWLYFFVGGPLQSVVDCKPPPLRSSLWTTLSNTQHRCLPQYYFNEMFLHSLAFPGIWPTQHVDPFSCLAFFSHCFNPQYMGTISGLQRSANELVDYIDQAKVSTQLTIKMANFFD